MESRNIPGDYYKERSGEALLNANKKLNLLIQITRHDIRSHLRQIGGFAELARTLEEDPEVRRYLAKIGELVAASNRIIDFSQDYQNIGLAPPSWQKLSDVIRGSLGMVPFIPVPVLYGVEGIEVFADPLLPAVFRNIFENAIRHGQKTTLMRISFRKFTEELVLIIEDDGIGLPSEKKSRIFQQDHRENGKNGLFLSRQILDITGISIQEAGQAGHGARFEIAVPEGSYRMQQSSGDVVPVQHIGAYLAPPDTVPD
jgi:signal transduction histidine kinase